MAKRNLVFLGTNILLLVATYLCTLQDVSAVVLIDESFEDIATGSVPEKWGVTVSGGAKIEVVEKGNQWGKKCLLFQNAKDAQQVFEPDLEIAIDMGGIVKLSFDVLVEDKDVQFRIAPRKDPSGEKPAISGAYLVIGNQGKISDVCADEWAHFGDISTNEWVHVEMVMRMQTVENPSWDLKLTRGGKTETYDKLGYLKAGENPDMLTRLVFHGSNKEASAFYLDNLLLEASETQKAGEQVKKNLCLILGRE